MFNFGKNEKIESNDMFKPMFMTYYNEKEEKIIEDFESLLLKSGFKILKKVEHYFDLQGYTGIWLLAESHFAIHTFPKEDKIYIELSSCVKSYFDKFVKNRKNI